MLNIRPQKFCSHAGCHALIDYSETYCEKHRKQKSHETMLKHKRNDQFEALYHSSQWRKTSLLYREHNPFCEKCLTNGKHTFGTSVDHIKSLKLGGDPFDWDNLETLCAKCHNKKTREEQKYYKSINK